MWNKNIRLTFMEVQLTTNERSFRKHTSKQYKVPISEKLHPSALNNIKENIFPIVLVCNTSIHGKGSHSKHVQSIGSRRMRSGSVPVGNRLLCSERRKLLNNERASVMREGFVLF